MVRRARKAFTLVELLIVMAIIALLSLLLLAALRFAYHAARNTQCLNNLAEIGRGLHSFANRNKQWGPPGPPNSYTSGQVANILWVSTPEPVTRRVPPPYPRDFATRPTNWLNHGFLWRDRDLNDERVYYCPDGEGSYVGGSFVNSGPYGFDATVGLYETNTMPPAGLKWMGSYDYRSFYDFDPSNGYNGTYYPINFGKQSAETAVIADAVQNPSGSRRAHNNQIYNVVFADGHGVTVDDNNKRATLLSAGWTYIASANLAGNNWPWLERIFTEILSRP